MTDQEIQDCPTNPSMAITTTTTTKPATIRVLVPSWCNRILFLRLLRMVDFDDDFFLDDEEDEDVLCVIDDDAAEVPAN